MSEAEVNSEVDLREYNLADDEQLRVEWTVTPAEDGGYSAAIETEVTTLSSPYACLEEGCHYRADTFESLRNHCSGIHDGISMEMRKRYGPDYQNPEKLEEAYEATESVPELIDYLGSDIAVPTAKDYLSRYNIGVEQLITCPHPECDRQSPTPRRVRLHYYRSHGQRLPGEFDLADLDQAAFDAWFESDHDPHADDEEVGEDEDEREGDDHESAEDADEDEDDGGDDIDPELASFETALERDDVLILGQLVRACDLDREQVIEELRARDRLSEYTGRLSDAPGTTASDRSSHPRRSQRTRTEFVR